ncbi:MAG TPA: hypothetical protein PK691_04640, partial [Thermomicrobiales bacterium]|nr:hypothetical protein [Thermomicrobiales bacterium]
KPASRRQAAVISFQLMDGGRSSLVGCGISTKWDLPQGFHPRSNHGPSTNGQRPEAQMERLSSVGDLSFQYKIVQARRIVVLPDVTYRDWLGCADQCRV